MIIGKAMIPGRQAPPAPPFPYNVNDATWEQISEVSIAGTGDTYWDIGDCKAVTLNGKIGDYLTLSNTTLYVFILDFNHPINKTTADNNIIWGGFKTAATNGIDVALRDSYYNTRSYSGAKVFNLNHYGTNNASPYNTDYGGWKGCDSRYDILGGTSTPPSQYGYQKTTSNVGYDATQATINTPVANTLMAALPSDFRAVLRLWNRYIDYVGNKSNVDANCSTATVDAISLLSEYEVYGEQGKANQYEQNHQKQMTYYANGNSRDRVSHNDIEQEVDWWLASPAGGGAFVAVTHLTGVQAWVNQVGLGMAPAFRT